MLRGEELNEEVPNWQVRKFRNNQINSHINFMQFQAGVFPILGDIVVSSPNFKVRLSAAVALAAPCSRKHYYSFYLMAWKSLLEALSSADNIQDFKEFQHRDNLVYQVLFLKTCKK